MIAARSGQATLVSVTNGSASRDRRLVRRRSRPSPASRAARRGRCASPPPPAPRRAARRRATSTPSVVSISRARSAGSAAAVAELQATTSSFTRRAISSSATSSANASSSACAAVAVREARGVGEVDEVLVRQLHEQLVQHGQPADAGVEHPDRAPAQLLGTRVPGTPRQSGTPVRRGRRCRPCRRRPRATAYSRRRRSRLELLHDRVGDPLVRERRRSP